MDKNRQRKRKRSNTSVVGGHRLPNLLIWGGTLLMLTGGVIAYPTIQNYLAPPDSKSLEFSVTLAPHPTVVALQSTPQAAQPSACPDGQCEGEQNRVQEAAAQPGLLGALELLGDD